MTHKPYNLKYIGNDCSCTSGRYQAVFFPPTQPWNEARICYAILGVMPLFLQAEGEHAE